jgi:hypothetical protein
MDRENKIENQCYQEEGRRDLSFVLGQLDTNKELAPYHGSMPAHKPNNFIRWEEAEDEHGFKRYLEKYYNPDLPQKYQLTGDWGYSFNSLGYRGEEYNPDAKFHIFTCGCSYTYGMGIKWEQSFSYVFKEELTKKLNYNIEDVNLLNFSQQAASNDYITRTVLTQCQRVKPNLLIIQFTTKDRSEYISHEKVGNIGPWIENDEALSYYSFYTEELGLINTLKNMLLVQNFCKLHNIKYIFSLFHYNELFNPIFSSNPLIKTYLEQLDSKYITAFSLADFRCDVGRMGHHPGPLSNLRFGKKLISFYHDNFS